MTKLLLEQPSLQANIGDSVGWTPLHYAFYNGYRDIILLLLRSRKVDRNAKNMRGMTPFQIVSTEDILSVDDLRSIEEFNHTEEKTTIVQEPSKTMEIRIEEPVFERKLSERDIDLLIDETLNTSLDYESKKESERKNSTEIPSPFKIEQTMRIEDGDKTNLEKKPSGEVVTRSIWVRSSRKVQPKSTPPIHRNLYRSSSSEKNVVEDPPLQRGKTRPLSSSADKINERMMKSNEESEKKSIENGFGNKIRSESLKNLKTELQEEDLLTPKETRESFDRSRGSVKPHVAYPRLPEPKTSTHTTRRHIRSEMFRSVIDPPEQ
eukprot:TRINITY_DN4891_c0_g1_i1.p1 TRINITY_DN4891_c0_g1~~TRINITY_DN4891_c0_g1_i1.p1  ORF type:complete len:321 (+),score=67.23 TRINITY_DN4891_c0_g1_i1:226-1188(+)